MSCHWPLDRWFPSPMFIQVQDLWRDLLKQNCFDIFSMLDVSRSLINLLFAMLFKDITPVTVFSLPQGL